jgi:3-phosphoshikimate 1-carboxyvinyltransferase
MAVTKAKEDTIIHVDGPVVSEPYVTMTVAMLRQFGFDVERPAPDLILVPSRQRPCGHEPTNYLVEPDASAASYFFAAAAITGGRIGVVGFRDDSLQGDLAFVDVLSTMGCSVGRHAHQIVLYAGNGICGIDIDMNAISDTVMTLAAVACFADGPTTIRNVAHIRLKETDRLAALATELRRVGAEVVEFADGLTITPRPLHGAEIETYNDHRMAMSMALIGLRVPGIVITNPGCVAKTYPGFWDDLEKLRVS